MANPEALTARQAFEQRAGVYDRAPFGRVITAMVTPFDNEGGLNLDVAQELAVYLEASGSEGLVVAGTTGEASTLSHSEQIELFRAVRGAVQIPVLAGTGSNNTAEAVELTREVSEKDLADGILVVSPYYNRPPQSGIVKYFQRVFEATKLPGVLYDIPVRTGREVDTDCILRLAATIPNLVAVKDAAGKPKKSERLIREGADHFTVYSGDDSRNLELYSAGAVGAISVASHWAGREIARMFDKVEKKNKVQATQIDTALKESYCFEGSDRTPNPIPAKAMMRMLGINVGYGRSPIELDSPADEQRLEEVARNVYDNMETHSI